MQPTVNLFEGSTRVAFSLKVLGTAIHIMCNMLLLSHSAVLNYIFRDLFLMVFKGGGEK